MKKLAPFFLVLVLIACNNGGEEPKPDIPPVKRPNIMSYSVLAAYPHDTSSYTQGLIVYKGQLYEGTGNYGVSLSLIHI